LADVVDVGDVVDDLTSASWSSFPISSEIVLEPKFRSKWSSIACSTASDDEDVRMPARGFLDDVLIDGLSTTGSISFG
jgi:hypothetical protein